MKKILVTIFLSCACAGILGMLVVKTAERTKQEAFIPLPDLTIEEAEADYLSMPEEDKKDFIERIKIGMNKYIKNLKEEPIDNQSITSAIKIFKQSLKNKNVRKEQFQQAIDILKRSGCETFNNNNISNNCHNLILYATIYSFSLPE